MTKPASIIRLMLHLFARVVIVFVVFIGLAQWAGQRLSGAGQMAFISSRRGYNRMYLMDVQRRMIYKLSDIQVNSCCLAWSPDGQQLAFVSDVALDGNDEIFLIQPDTGRVQRLTTAIGIDWFPRWSPDGRQIAFTSYRDGNGNIYVMDADGRHQRALTDDKERDSTAAWSPDGKHIAFVSMRHFNPEIFQAEANCSAPCENIQLTNEDADDSEPAWTPDGQHMVFISNRGGTYRIYQRSANGEAQPVTHHDKDDIGLFWSPDGQRLAFVAVVWGVASYVGVMDADGQHQRWLLRDTAMNPALSWSPDSQQLAFVSGRDGNTEIYLVSINGLQQRRLTVSRASDILPVWRP